MLVTLDLSAAFDTVDHGILLRRLDDEFAIRDSALSWLESYLSDRKQFIKLGESSTNLFSLDVGVPQGSVLGPILFTTYTSPIGDQSLTLGTATICTQMTPAFTCLSHSPTRWPIFKKPMNASRKFNSGIC